jgi:tetratricopeptide (TPR) repeat protein
MKNLSKRWIYIGIIALVVLSSGLISCNDEEFFQLEAPPETEWRNIDELERAIAFPYRNTFVNGEASIGIMTHFIHLMMSDMVRRIGENPGWQSPDIYGRNTSNRVPNTENKYRPAYVTIAATNKILDFLAGDPFPDATAANRANNINRIKGEALFLRAYSYFHLAQLHCPPYDPSGSNESKVLSIRTSFPDNVNSALDNSPSTTKEVYDQIVADFKEATELLPKQWSAGMSQAYRFGRATKHAAAFYYAKTLLHMGSHQEALQVLNSILDDPEKPRSLEPDPTTVFENNSQAAPFESPEVIFSAFYADPLRTSPRHAINIYYFTNKLFPDPADFRDWWIITLDNEVMNRCNILVDGQWTTAWEGDKRNRLYHRWKGADPNAVLRGSQNNEYMTNTDIARFVQFDDPVLMVNKYYRVPFYQNMPLVRTAEALILRAAIKAENGDGAGAAADLNVVRQRAWDESLLGPFEPLATADFAQVDIEWIKELAFEADRVSFLQMFRKPIGPAERNVPEVLPPYNGFNWNIPIGETDFR